MDPIIAAAAISAGAGLVGGISGSNVSKHEAQANRREARRQFDQQMNESVQRRVADAIKAGINPLTALGYNGGASPTIHAGGTSGAGEIMSNAISNAGHSLSKGLEKAMEDKAADDINYDSEMKELDLEGKRLENRILESKLNSLTDTPGQDVSAPRPTGDLSDLLFIPVYDMQGNPRLTINQSVMEADNDNAGYRSAMLGEFKRAYKKGFIDRDGNIKSQALLDKIDQDYYDRTGKHIANLGSAYISGAEAGMVLYDEIKDVLNTLMGIRDKISNH